MVTRHIVLLRGINLGSRNRIPMQALKDALLEDTGVSDVATYLQSGNIAFDGEASHDLPDRIKSLIKAKFGFDVPVVTRTLAEIQAAIKAQPFKSDPAAWHVTFLDREPDPAKIATAERRIGNDRWHIIGRDVYLEIPDGRYSETKLQNQWFESKLGVTATTRNWKTVLALAEL